MSNGVVLKVALANLDSQVDPEDVYQFVESRAEDIQTYHVDTKKVSCAAIDWIIILGVSGSIASLASLLWMAYEKFIASKKAKDGDAGIYIAIERPDGTLVKLWIGNEYRDKDIFIRDFTTEIALLREDMDAPVLVDAAEREIKDSGLWIRRR